MYRITVTDLDTGTETQREDVPSFLLVTALEDDTTRNRFEADQGMSYYDIARVCIGAIRTVKKLIEMDSDLADIIKNPGKYFKDDDQHWEADGDV